jgi:hypothetical protein
VAPSTGTCASASAARAATESRRTPAAAASYDVATDPGGQAPGREEEGGYVNVEDHRY